MPQMTIEQAFHMARTQHQAGQLPQAEQLYRQILQQEPNHFDAMHLLGVLACQAGQSEAGAALIQRAIALRPGHAEAYNNLGSAFKGAGHFDRSIAAYRQAIALNLEYAEAFSNLGNALKDKGEIAEAIAACRRAIVLKPDYHSAHGNLGICLQRIGQIDDAIAAFSRAIAINPNHSDNHGNLGVLLSQKGRTAEAIESFSRAIALNANSPQALSNLGNLLTEIGRTDEAIAACRQATALKPDFAEAHGNLGFALKDQGLLDEAIAAYRQAIALEPRTAVTHGNLATLLKDTGHIAEAIPEFRTAVALNPDIAQARSNLLYSLHFHPEFTAKDISAEHSRWNLERAESLKRFAAPHANVRDPDRRLKIGYVSSDFREHPVARFLLPLIEHHDHSLFEIICYSDKGRVDATTARLRASSDNWREIAHVSDEDAAAQIRADEIDILIDLAGHTAGNRLMVFASKPAPVQVSYLGYPDTTGLTTIDCRLTDALADPVGSTDANYSEKLYRLPTTAWCFEAPDEMAASNEPAAPARNDVTFGSFNIVAKMSDPLLETWANVLNAVPNSRLFLKAGALAVPSASRRIIDAFAAHDIEAGRLKLRGHTTDYASHLSLYRNVDIALDTFPYNGTTTTCEALWMGVPVIVLAGNSHVSRVGVSLLTNVALPSLIANTPDEYVSLASALARDQQRLLDMRSNLRRRMLQSPVMNAPQFARDVESAYRQMWREWCASPAGRG